MLLGVLVIVFAFFQATEVVQHGGHLRIIRPIGFFEDGQGPVQELFGLVYQSTANQRQGQSIEEDAQRRSLAASMRSQILRL